MTRAYLPGPDRRAALRSIDYGSRQMRTLATPTSRSTRAQLPRAGPRLFLLAFLLLFVELVLIRWTAAYVVYLSYFTNFVLLGSFLGIGIGFLRPRPQLFRFAPLSLAAVVALVYFVPIRISHSGGRLIYFGAHTGGTPIWLALPIVFAAVTLAMMLIAGAAAETFGRLAPLTAYRLDILGSIAGTATFALMSLLGLGPFAWGVTIAVLFALLWQPPSRLLPTVGVVALLVPLGLASFRSDTVWSPYYAIKIQTFPVTYGNPPTTRDVYRLSVNGVPHQLIAPLPVKLEDGDYYRIPYERLRGNALRQVLVIGAGDGTDVTLALRHGARRVDAVEIDPELLRLGRRRNPDRPYADPRVHTHVTDGRAFLERTHRRYDLILFALPDSLTLVANQSSLRLESYLFTVEALRAARDRLTPDGAFAMYNFYRQQWLVDRFAATLAQTFGHSPCIDERVSSGAVYGPVADLVVARDADRQRCAAVWRPSGRTPAPATDDHPFPYLEHAGLPAFYLFTLGLVLSASALAVGACGVRPAAMRPYVDLFFMGAAFLLLETKSVVQFALLFGTTWLVNALVFIGILAAVLLAIEVAERLPRRHSGWLYLALAVALLASLLVPARDLLQLSFWPRLAMASALAFAPVFVANLIFADRFRDTASSTTAFGTNLLGAMVGGVLEYTSLVIGYRSLLLVVAALYGCAFASGIGHLRRARDLGEAEAVGR
jgi:SAM-dependent methyltransferase